MSEVIDVPVPADVNESLILAGHRKASDGLKSPGSKHALARFLPKLLQGPNSNQAVLFHGLGPVVTVISGSMDNALFSLEQKLLRAYPPRFRLAYWHAFQRRDVDGSPKKLCSVLNDLKAVVKPAFVERSRIANIQKSIDRCPPSTPPFQSLPSSSSIVTIDDFPENYLNALEDSAGTTTTIVKAWLSDEENMPLYPPTPSPSFEVIRIFPSDDMDVSDDTILPLSLNAPSARSGPSPITTIALNLKNSLNREVIKVLLITLFCTVVLVLGFGLLIHLVHRMGSLYACVLMVALSFYLGVQLVLRKCVTKRPPTFGIRDSDDLAVQYNDFQSARFDSSEHGQSSVVQINGRFEISSLRSSQDIFRSELLTNGQVISVRATAFYLHSTNPCVHP